MAFHPDLPKKLGLPYDVYFNRIKDSQNYKGKPVAVLTRNLRINPQTKTDNLFTEKFCY